MLPLPHPQSMPWQDDPYGLLHRLFWNERPPDPDEGVFRILGVVHLYASSGIHLYAFLQTMEWLAFPLARRFRLDLRWSKRVTLASGVALLLWAWSLQSFRPGFARPLVTYFIRRWGAQHGAKFRILAPLAATLALDLLLDFGGGRAHYYLAIAGGLLAMERLGRRAGRDPPSILATHVALSVGSWILTAPLDLLTQHRIAWATPLYSLLTLPVLSHLLYPASLLSLAIDGQIHPLLLRGWNALMEGIVWVADALPGPITVHDESLWIGAGVAALGTWTLRQARRPGRDQIRPLAILLLACAIARPILRDSSRLTQLDVGQGDALLIRTPDRTEMIDAGPERGLRSSGWIERFSARRITRIDAILLTHLDADHVRGLDRMLPWIQLDCVQTHARHWTSEKGGALARFIHEFAPQTRLMTDGCIRSATVGWFGSHSDHADGNGWMAGVMIPLAPDRVYLALGDGDQEQEGEYWRRWGATLREYPHRIWKLSHHGSRFSSAAEFLRRLDPEKIWISVGKYNPYRHPSAATLQRLRALNDEERTQRTDVAGDLTEKISQPSRLSTRANWLRK